MSAQLESLLLRYKNKMFLQDDNGLMAVLLFNETREVINNFIVKFYISKLSFISEKQINVYNPIKKHQQIITVKNRKFDIVKFVTYALERGYDWEVYGKPQWEAIQPIVKKKFMKPKVKTINNKNN